MTALLLLALAVPAPAEQALQIDRPGVTYEITRHAQSEEKGSDGSTGTTRDTDVLIERVLAVRDDGIELEYDLPRNTSAEDRKRDWEFPLHAFRPTAGAPKLLDIPVLEARITAWLKWGKVPRAACGHWVFTWNAFKIECDPQSALATVASFDLRVGTLRDGTIYTDGVSGPIVLKQVSSTRFAGEAPLDAERLRREEAQADIDLAEMMNRKIPTMDDALRAHASEKITGTRTIAFETDGDGNVRSRTTEVRIKTQFATGVTRDRIATQVLSRRAITDSSHR